MRPFLMRTLTIAMVVWLEMIRRKDVYVLLILSAGMLAVMMTLDVFGLGGVTAYLKDIGLLLAWIFSWLLAVSVSSREIPQEETRGTIFVLLAKPIRRVELLAGKWLGAWSAVSVATFCFYVLAMSLVAVKGGAVAVPVTLQAFVLHAAALAVICAIGVMFSTRMNYDAAASLTSLLTCASLLVVPRIPEFVAREGTLRAGLLLMMYNLLPHFEVFDLRMRAVHGYGLLDLSAFALVLLYGLLLTVLFLLVAWLAYRDKRFSRGSLL